MNQGETGLPHKEAAAVFHEKGHLSALESSLGHRFHDLGLLQRALTHPSLAGAKNYQRLEFLGDAVLQLCISQELFVKTKRESEGQLTRRRQQLVCEKTLSKVARSIQLGDYLNANPSFVKDGGMQLDSVLADAMEAVLAAVYLDAGLDVVQGMILRLWQKEWQQTDDSLDAKGALQAHFAAKGLETPVYRLLQEEGPIHQRMYIVQVEVEGIALATGRATSKKAAEQAAAKKALASLPEGRKE